VSIASPSDPPGVRFRISPPVAVSPGDVLVIEWLSPAPAGVQPGTFLSWMGEDSDSYPGGMNFSGCAGDPLPRPDRDLYFKTYSQ
jgi:hypothetical protein